MSRMTSKGQVTIPANLRKRMGLKPGDEIEFHSEGGKTVVRKRPPTSSKGVFEQFVGMYPAFKSSEEVIAYHRDLRDED
jgi:antitoxin PrlF